MADFKLKHLITTGVREAEMIEALLEDNEIEVIVRHDEFGEYSMIYMGFSAYNIEIYVAEADYQQAKELLTGFNIDESEQEEDKTAVEENTKNEKTFSFYLALAAKIIIIIYILFNLFALIF